jgi:hypothetical protein
MHPRYCELIPNSERRTFAIVTIAVFLGMKTASTLETS